jgi:hypothetical protein
MEVSPTQSLHQSVETAEESKEKHVMMEIQMITSLLDVLSTVLVHSMDGIAQEAQSLLLMSAPSNVEMDSSQRTSNVKMATFSL